MSAKKYKVATIAVMLKNGTMAKYGEEVSKDQINNFDSRVEDGFIEEADDFDKREAESKKSEDKGKKAAEPQTDDSKAELDARAKYNEAFGKEAPLEAKLPALLDAVKTKKAL